MSKRILHVVSNVAHYDDPTHPTGLWLSELTHAWDVFAARGFDQRIVSPKGGVSPLEPRALKWPLLDASAKAWLGDPTRMTLLENTAQPEDIDPADFDAIYFTGGHAVMWDFPNSNGLQAITRAIWERGGVVSSVCHGYCGLLNTRLSDGSLLVAGKQITGFSWAEEVLAGRALEGVCQVLLRVGVRGQKVREEGAGDHDAEDDEAQHGELALPQAAPGVGDKAVFLFRLVLTDRCRGCFHGKRPLSNGISP